MTLVDSICQHAIKHPKKTAYTFIGRHDQDIETLSFGELDKLAREYAQQLLNLADSQSRVILAYPSGLEFITSFVACLYAGMIAVPVYSPKGQSEWQRLMNILDNCEASILACPKSQLDEFTAQLNDKPIQCLSFEVTSASNQALPLITEDHLAFLQYTSGTTGNPKGVMVSHKNLLHNESLIHQSFEHDENTVVAGWLPLFHDMGLIGNTLHGLYLGTHTVFMSPMSFIYRPARWLKMISDYKATTSGGPNFAYEHCVKRIKDSELEGLDLSQWKIAFNGSEMIRPHTLEEFSERFKRWGFKHHAHFPCYGMAETTLFVTGSNTRKAPNTLMLDAQKLSNNIAKITNRGRRYTSCGKVLGQEIAIVNPKDKTPCQPFEIGEVWVRGDSVSQGYWQQEALNQEIFQAQLQGQTDTPYLRTGDAGFIDDKGELYITGRLKEMVIIRGKNHFPQDIETSAQLTNPALRHGFGAAFSVDNGQQESLVLINEVCKHHKDTIDIEQLHQSISERLRAEQAIELSALILIKQGTLPRTTSGKIRRRHCRDLFINNAIEKVIASTSA